MGLAAGQARLLTITGRKSDCEFESMRLSHQKIALARQLADLSNEYQNSLEQTKLVYDFYGTGDTSTPLSYGLLMTPSALNNYMPTILTDSMGRVVLNGTLAAAARAAGIPQEGLGTLPSETMRNKFIYALGENGVISPAKAEKIMELPYSQQAGFGGGSTVSYATESGVFEELCNHFNDIGAMITFDLPDKSCYENVGGKNREFEFEYKNVGDADKTHVDCDTNNAKETVIMSLGDLLKGDGAYANLYMHAYRGGAEVSNQFFDQAAMIMESVLDQMGSYMTDVLDLHDGFTATAIEYATEMIKEMYVPYNNTGSDDNGGIYNKKCVDYSAGIKGGNRKNAENYIGWVGWRQTPSRGVVGIGSRGSKYDVAIDVGKMLEAYLTYFADFMNGVSKTDAYGKEIFNVEQGEIGESHLAGSNNTYEYTWLGDSAISSDDMGFATFYDTLFNQICANGWVENERIIDNDYMKDMLQNGMYYISTIKDDNFYYQGNYATNTYIKEVADEKLIAQAEAKYNTEKAKLNAKEETLDMKMKNLDTEISSLTTEYDTVKNTLSKNIDRGFKRYNA